MTNLTNLTNRTVTIDTVAGVTGMVVTPTGRVMYTDTVNDHARLMVLQGMMPPVGAITTFEDGARLSTVPISVEQDNITYESDLLEGGDIDILADHHSPLAGFEGHHEQVAFLCQAGRRVVSTEVHPGLQAAYSGGYLQPLIHLTARRVTEALTEGGYPPQVLELARMLP